MTGPTAGATASTIICTITHVFTKCLGWRAAARRFGSAATAVAPSNSAGDIVILPAGIGHQCLAATKDFLVVGAYPPSGAYDECRPDAHEHDGRVKSVAKVKRPRKDPVFGAKGPLLNLWKLRT